MKAYQHLTAALITGLLSYAAIVASTSYLGSPNWNQASSETTVGALGTSARVVRDIEQVPEPRSTQAQAPRTQTKEVTCPCEDCDCPHEMICKNGHCKSRYPIVFSITGCLPCTRMYPVVYSLRDQGYPVYFFKDYHDVAAKYSVRVYPTTVVFDEGREVKRFEGVIDEQTLKRHL